MNKLITKYEQELLQQLREPDHSEATDDFYRESCIEEQLDSDSIDEEEVAFMMGYLAA